MEPGREGGTWLALNEKTGKIGILLNLNGIQKSVQGKGRGFLIKNYLMSMESTKNYAQNLVKYSSDYNPFNLVMIEIKYVILFFFFFYDFFFRIILII